MLRILLLVVVCVFVHAEHEPERVRGPVTVSPIAGMIRAQLSHNEFGAVAHLPIERIRKIVVPRDDRAEFICASADYVQCEHYVLVGQLDAFEQLVRSMNRAQGVERELNLVSVDRDMTPYTRLELSDIAGFLVLRDRRDQRRDVYFPADAIVSVLARDDAHTRIRHEDGEEFIIPATAQAVDAVIITVAAASR